MRKSQNYEPRCRFLFELSVANNWTVEAKMCEQESDLWRKGERKNVEGPSVRIWKETSRVKNGNKQNWNYEQECEWRQQVKIEVNCNDRKVEIEVNKKDSKVKREVNCRDRIKLKRQKSRDRRKL